MPCKTARLRGLDLPGPAVCTTWRQNSGLAPELWPVMVVDDNGHGKGLPLNQRAGLLYGGEIVGDIVLGQERRRPLGTGFT
jgi:hypothetical protein